MSSSVHENYWRRTRGLIDVRGSVMGQWPIAAIGMFDPVYDHEYHQFERVP